MGLRAQRSGWAVKVHTQGPVSGHCKDLGLGTASGSLGWRSEVILSRSGCVPLPLTLCLAPLAAQKEKEKEKEAKRLQQLQEMDAAAAKASDGYEDETDEWEVGQQ